MTGPIRAEDVEPEAVDWLWMERIPRGMFTVVAGRPDQGKGLFCARVAADVSNDGGFVLYSAIEDAFGLMTRPRLEAAGANLKNIRLWRFQLPDQQRELEALVKKNGYDLVVIDPFAAHLGGGKISRHSDTIRSILNPLTDLMEETGVSILIVEHALKRVSQNAHPLTAVGGSGSGLPAAARMGYLFGVDPADNDKRILACVKSNLRELPKALAFEVDTVSLDVVGEVPALVQQGECVFDPIRLVATDRRSSSVRGRPPDKRAAACEWLTNYLWEAKVPVRAGKVMEDAKHYLMTEKTLRRAAEDMRIVKTPPGGGRNCTWWLPQEIIDILVEADQDLEALEALSELEPAQPELQPADDEEKLINLEPIDLEALMRGEDQNGQA